MGDGGDAVSPVGQGAAAVGRPDGSGDGRSTLTRQRDSRAVKPFQGGQRVLGDLGDSEAPRTPPGQDARPCLASPDRAYRLYAPTRTPSRSSPRPPEQHPRCRHPPGPEPRRTSPSTPQKPRSSQLPELQGVARIARTRPPPGRGDILSLDQSNWPTLMAASSAGRSPRRVPPAGFLLSRTAKRSLFGSTQSFVLPPPAPL